VTTAMARLSGRAPEVQRTPASSDGGSEGRRLHAPTDRAATNGALQHDGGVDWVQQSAFLGGSAWCGATFAF